MTNPLNRVFLHLRQGTLGDVLRKKLGIARQDVRVHWFGAESEEDAAGALAKQGQRAWRARGGDGWVAVVGNGSTLQRGIGERLQRQRVPHRLLDAAALFALAPGEIANLRIIVCAMARSADIADLGSRLVSHPELSRITFEYAPGIDPERSVFRNLDEYRDTFFVSPALRDAVPVYQIYEESLTRFEQKCGLRDYLDLYQLLRHVHTQNIPGAIAEFGSFRGHSGWLIARLLKALGSDKKVYLFDTFEAFPTEDYGVDSFWSSTHHVDFNEVKSKFHDLDNVEFVKGDFTVTLPQMDIKQLAVAYIDCDSYRATRFLVEHIYDRQLSKFGVMAFEDYGHLALLGNRLAVDETVRSVNRGFQFFSQFSGIYAVLKID